MKRSQPEMKTIESPGASTLPDSIAPLRPSNEDFLCPKHDGDSPLKQPQFIELERGSGWRLYRISWKGMTELRLDVSSPLIRGFVAYPGLFESEHVALQISDEMLTAIKKVPQDG